MEEEEEEEEEEEFAPHPDCQSTILFTNRPTGGKGASDLVLQSENQSASLTVAMDIKTFLKSCGYSDVQSILFILPFAITYSDKYVGHQLLYLLFIPHYIVLTEMYTEVIIHVC